MIKQLGTLELPKPTSDQKKYLAPLQKGYMTREEIAAVKTPIGPPSKRPTRATQPRGEKPCK